MSLIHFFENLSTVLKKTTCLIINKQLCLRTLGSKKLEYNFETFQQKRKEPLRKEPKARKSLNNYTLVRSEDLVRETTVEDYMGLSQRFACASGKVSATSSSFSFSKRRVSLLSRWQPADPEPARSCTGAATAPRTPTVKLCLEHCIPSAKQLEERIQMLGEQKPFMCDLGQMNPNCKYEAVRTTAVDVSLRSAL